MQEQVKTRLETLRAEYQNGQQMLQELQQKQLNLEQTMLRIAGAIQVLEELSGDGNGHVVEKEIED